MEERGIVAGAAGPANERPATASARKQTLYDALGVPADATQAQIAEAGASMRARMQTGAHTPDVATLNYAIETLCNPEARRQYDESLRRGTGLPARNPAFADSARSLAPDGAMPSMRAAAGARRRAAILLAAGIVVALGMLLWNRHDVEKLEAEQAKFAAERARIAAEQAKAAHSAAVEAERSRRAASAEQRAAERQARVEQEAALHELRRSAVADRAPAAQVQPRLWTAPERSAAYGRVAEPKYRADEAQMPQLERERARSRAEQEVERQRMQLIEIYLGRNQFLLARDVARTPEEFRHIERAEGVERQRQETLERERAAEEERKRAAEEARQRAEEYRRSSEEERWRYEPRRWRRPH